MLRTFASIEKLPVILRQNGEEIGFVLDLLFQEDKVVGFLVDKHGWLNGHLFLPLSHILGFGHDGLIVRDKQGLTPFSTIKENVIPLKIGRSRLYGKPLLSEEGERLGLIEDVYFLEEMGMIIGYEVTDGLLADLTEGRKVVRGKGPLTIGKDVVILSI
ncbi:PRC-barrel domain-containing protein [Halalkalibacterium ligniniphilum]|uniref:PRC-barrel domain-containing protein n=1 Tax=Halalkalibacterium ligniniphilum TaxID=1134413 RepID=UPI001F19638B|nr:PRC-barrel domain-containing protein [Halalkalibacterium ligniniphilum]